MPKLILVVTALSIAVAQAAESELNRGRLAWSAFQCSVFAELSVNAEEQERLFVLGYETSQSLLNDSETMSAAEVEREKETIPVFMLLVLGGPSIDFIVGRIFSAAQERAFNSVVKTDSSGLVQIDPNKWADGELKKIRAENKYRESNCALLGI